MARAVNRHHVYELYAAGCRDIIRETYDSSLRMGRSAFEALGTTREQAEDLTQVFETADRRSMIELADVFDIDTPPWENQEMIAAIKRLREQMDPLLQDQIAEIMGRDDLRDAAE